MEKAIIMLVVVTGPSPTVVLVHGGFVDGSGWEDVYKILKKLSRSDKVRRIFRGRRVHVLLRRTDSFGDGEL